MSGSRRWFGYEADNGTDYCVELDESVAESVALGFGVVVAGADPINTTGKLPISLRYINVFRVVDDITQRRKFYVGTLAAFATLQAAGTATIDGTLWQISSAIGEQRKIVPGTDSALLDGDLDSN
jgi:hypothetical protein